MSDPKQSADPAGEEPNEPGNGGVTVIVATGPVVTVTPVDPVLPCADAEIAEVYVPGVQPAVKSPDESTVPAPPTALQVKVVLGSGLLAES